MIQYKPMKEILQYAYQSRYQFMKYFLVGISGVVIDLLTLRILKEYAGFTPTYAVVLNQVLLLSYNFTLNKYWSFRNELFSKRQLAKYLTLSTWNYIFSVFTMWLFTQRYDIANYQVVRLGAIAIMVGWNFFLYKHWVFVTKTSAIITDVDNLASTG